MRTKGELGRGSGHRSCRRRPVAVGAARHAAGHVQSWGRGFWQGDVLQAELGSAPPQNEPTVKPREGTVTTNCDHIGAKHICGTKLAS
jgi:hypothetical protein